MHRILFAAVVLATTAVQASERYFPVSHFGFVDEQAFARLLDEDYIPGERFLSDRESALYDRLVQRICDALGPGTRGRVERLENLECEVGPPSVEWFTGQFHERRAECVDPRDANRTWNLTIHDATAVLRRGDARDGEERDSRIAFPKGLGSYFAAPAALQPVSGLEIWSQGHALDEKAGARAMKEIGAVLDDMRFPPVPLFIDACRPLSAERREAAEAAVYRAVFDVLERARVESPSFEPNHRYVLSTTTRGPPLFTVEPRTPRVISPAFSREAFDDYTAQNAGMPVFPRSLAAGIPAMLRDDPPPPPASKCKPVRGTPRFAFVMDIIRGGGPPPKPLPGPPVPQESTVRLSRVGFSSDLTQAVVYARARGDAFLCGEALVFRRVGGEYRIFGGWEVDFCPVY